jgi:hypothetical protein
MKGGGVEEQCVARRERIGLLGVGPTSSLISEH